MNERIKWLVWVPSAEEIEKERLWIEAECERLGLPILQELAIRSMKARSLAYVPYSHYQVGVSVLAKSGQFGDGANIEVASYSETGHAEEQAAKGLVMMGEKQRSGRKFIEAVAVCHDGDTAPCGRCRQILIEFCDNALVVVVDPQGEIRRITSMGILLPYAFKPSDLGID